MTGPRPANLVRRVLAVTVAVLVAAACTQGGASKADARVCSRLQGVVDALAGGRSAAAMSQLSALDVEVQLADDDRLRAAGNDFFEGITGQVDGFENLTFDQTVELSQQLVAGLVPSLGTMLQRCKDLDVAVDLTSIP